MKKVLAGIVLASCASVAFADGHKGYGPAGCGLGTAYVFTDATEWHEHVLAATTNGTSGNQTFGMTSGTLGCEAANGPLKAKIQEALSFMDNNMDQLALDSARGEGETLAALSEVMGVEPQDQAEFQKILKNNFDMMFNEQSTSGSAHTAMINAMEQSSTLKKYVS